MKWTERNTWLSAALASLGVVWLMAKGSRAGILPPVQGRISSGYGNRPDPHTGQTRFHNGIDFAVPVGTLVVAPADGVVYHQYSNSVGGRQMLIKHDNGLITGYAHLNGYAVSAGSRVRKGQGIAYSGNTGNSTGPHLHFTVRDRDGNLQDPTKFIA